MMMKNLTWLVFALFFLILMNSVWAQSQVIDVSTLKEIALPIHILELVLALFIAFMSLKFFRITKPIGLFLLVYIGVGFFIISSLIYLFLYLSLDTQFALAFVHVYVGSRIALMGMLISFAFLFYQWNKRMRSSNTK